MICDWGELCRLLRGEGEKTLQSEVLGCMLRRRLCEGLGVNEGVEAVVVVARCVGEGDERCEYGKKQHGEGVCLACTLRCLG